MQSISKFSTLDEVIERANKTVYGLAAAVFTKDVEKTQTLTRALEVGTVWLINIFKVYIYSSALCDLSIFVCSRINLYSNTLN